MPPYDAAVDDDWDAFADRWDDQAGTRAYASAAFDSLVSVLDEIGIELGGTTVVDFGCGTGLLTERLVDTGAEVVAVDTSAAMLAVLRAKIDRHGWTTVTTTSDLDEVPVGNDVIVCSSVCSFLDDYPATAARLVDLLRPGGLFIQWDWERDGDDHGLSRGDIADALSSAGLEGVEVATAFEIDADGHTMRPLVGHGRRPAAPSTGIGTDQR